jgi:hypothetical protein
MIVCARSKRGSQVSANISENGLGETVKFVRDAINNARDAADEGAILTEQVIQCGVALWQCDLPAYRRTLTLIRKQFSAELMRFWEKEVRRLERIQKAQDRASERAGRNEAHSTSHVDTYDEEAPLPDISAHGFGISVYIREPTPTNQNTLFRLMNREFALVPVAGKTRYMSISPAGELWFRNHEDLTAIFKNVPVYKMNAFDAWCSWEKRKTYAGVGFFPGSSVRKPRVPAGYLNTWQGFQLKPKKGAWGLLDKHLRKIVCGGNQTYADFLYDWLAHLVQVPQEKPGSCLVLRSSVEGSGKSMLVNSVLKPIFGEAATTIDKSIGLTGRFASFLEQNIILGVEEAIWAGSKADAGVVKNVITNARLKIERKGFASYHAPNYTRLIFTSNEDWVVPASLSARRFFALEVENSRANDPQYFDPLFDEIENGGVEAFLHDMLKRKITHTLSRPPKTEALSEQKKLSISPVERWALDVAISGHISVCSAHIRRTFRQKPIEAGLLVPTEDVREAAGQNLNVFQRMTLEGQLGRLLTNKKDGLGVKRVKATDGRGWDYVFPSLPEFRRRCSKRFGLTISGYDGSVVADPTTLEAQGDMAEVLSRVTGVPSTRINSLGKPQHEKARRGSVSSENCARRYRAA